ncbi:MAG: HK97-gp10 family putative phage morphogenesis protein [Gemmatimonadaceae bacterium]
MAQKFSAEFNVDVTVQNVDGLIANIVAKNKTALKLILAAVGNSAARLQQRTIDLCPKDTFYMSEHVRADFSENGYTYEVGWDAKDFLGTIDEKGRPRAFYPYFVELGTRHMAAQPSLGIAFAEEQPRYKAELANAMARAIG